ncbi:hypothetical protein PF001_g23907 [Phytophthora fragariae]|uniref:Protein kinase domain-containing protein n=1 Tax=Phytophthora fragariae TaxID=53985 RepID=A0A6A4C485_9STRA|nr:hypothetical protein PF001_g23907 [Phytophthora fragariae]
MNGLAHAREAPGTPVEKAPATVLEDVNAVIYPSSGLKLKGLLAEIEEELKEISAQFQDDNRRVVKRLLDIYYQLENSAEPLLAAIVEDFVGLVQSYHIQVSRQLENSNFSASDVMMSSVALTVADRNESMHHLLDELIWNSGCLSSKSAVHQWQEHSRKKARLRSQKMMGTVLEDEEADDDTTGGRHIDRPRWLLPTDEVQLLKRIAHGAFGAAYWGKWLDTDVVVKKVLTNQHESRNRQQFRHEVELWFSLNHANVIKLYGACHENDKQPVFVCEQAIHGTLSSFLKDKPTEEIWGALYTAAQGLRHLHELGIVHGDLKGNNVLVCDNNFVKLADFGLSAIAKPVLTPVDKPGSIGAIRWRAPECIQGFMPTFASDIYSFGMCIIEVVTGKLPWGNIPDPSVVRHVVDEKLLPSGISIDVVVCYIMAGMKGATSFSSNAARLFAKLEDMHGDIKLTHDQIKSCANRRALIHQAPILKKYAPAAAYALEDDEGGNDPTAENDMMEEKTPADTKADLEPSTVAGTKQNVSACSDHSSVPLLIQRLSSDGTTSQQKEKLLLDLLRVCVTNSNRVQVYKTKGIPVLTSLVREGKTFLSQLYALHGLSWFTFSFSKLRESEFESLLGCVREPMHTEMLSLLHELQSDDDEVKERAALQCSCMATGGAGDALRRVGVLPLLVGLLENGTANQKLWATEALVTLASDSDENCVAITCAGAIPPLVGLLRSGTDMHKQEAAYALGNLAANNDENRAKIAREGAIPPMVEFVKSVADAQNQWAVYALGSLALNNEENRVLIAQEGAIRPLVRLLRVGTHAQKQWSAYTLGNLALSDANRKEITLEGAIEPLHNLLRVGTTLEQKKWSAHTLENLAHRDANREEITLEGAIAPLIELLRAGTAMQKQRAAFALGNLACGNNTTADFDGAILPLVDVVRMGSDTQKEDAAYTLGNLAANNDAIRAKIGRQGAIAPLVKILKTGGGEQKQWAAFALRCLAHDNDFNRVAIVEEGAIEPLAAMMEEGTEEQKDEAARALEHLVVKENDATTNTFIPHRIMTPLMGYLRAEAISQNANVAATADLNTMETVRECYPAFSQAHEAGH